MRALALATPVGTVPAATVETEAKWTLTYRRTLLLPKRAQPSAYPSGKFRQRRKPHRRRKLRPCKFRQRRKPHRRRKFRPWRKPRHRHNRN